MIFHWQFFLLLKILVDDFLFSKSLLILFSFAKRSLPILSPSQNLCQYLFHRIKIIANVCQNHYKYLSLDKIIADVLCCQNHCQCISFFKIITNMLPLFKMIKNAFLLSESFPILFSCQKSLTILFSLIRIIFKIFLLSKSLSMLFSTKNRWLRFFLVKIRCQNIFLSK